jgi:hypothetical protein
MSPRPPSAPGPRLGLHLIILVAMAAGCSLLVEAALSDKDAGAGGATGSGGSPPSSTASVGSGAASTGTGTGAGGSTTSSASTGSSTSGGVGCDGSTMCMLANATSECSQGQCVIVSCTMGFGDCDNMPGDGCEAHLKSDPSHCGSCTYACQPGHACTGGTCK